VRLAGDVPDSPPAVLGVAEGPAGAPTVLLYSHYDVQPALAESAWDSPPFELTERDGRWYGRGAADCKGNIAMHLTALKALRGRLPVTVKVIVEGAEEQATGGIEGWVPRNADLLRADAIVIGDAGNFAVGVPTVTTSLRGIVHATVTVETLAGAVHSGSYGGAAPDALAALIRMLATLRDRHGNTTVRGLDDAARWEGVEYPEERFRADAGVLDGVDLLGDGAVADMVWARPALTVLGIDCPPVAGALTAIPPRARALLSLRIPPGTGRAEAEDALVAHLESVAPWSARVSIERGVGADPLATRTDGPAFAALGAAMREAFGREMAIAGEGGSIPLGSVLADTFPEAEIMLIGVEEPLCRIHAPNESVDPGEIERMALAEALFLQRYGV